MSSMKKRDFVLNYLCSRDWPKKEEGVADGAENAIVLANKAWDLLESTREKADGIESLSISDARRALEKALFRCTGLSLSHAGAIRHEFEREISGKNEDEEVAS